MMDLNTPAEDILCTVRAKNTVKNLGIKTVGDLCLWSVYDFQHARNVGKMVFGEVVDALGSRGLNLGMSEEDLRKNYGYSRFDKKFAEAIKQLRDASVGLVTAASKIVMTANALMKMLEEEKNNE